MLSSPLPLTPRNDASNAQTALAQTVGLGIAREKLAGAVQTWQQTPASGFSPLAGLSTLNPLCNLSLTIADEGGFKCGRRIHRLCPNGSNHRAASDAPPAATVLAKWMRQARVDMTGEEVPETDRDIRKFVEPDSIIDQYGVAQHFAFGFSGGAGAKQTIRVMNMNNAHNRLRPGYKGSVNVFNDVSFGSVSQSSTQSLLVCAGACSR